METVLPSSVINKKEMIFLDIRFMSMPRIVA